MLSGCHAAVPFTCGISIIAVPILHIIGMIEGIIYLCKPDAEFYQIYMVQQRQWFQPVATSRTGIKVREKFEQERSAWARRMKQL